MQTLRMPHIKKCKLLTWRFWYPFTLNSLVCENTLGKLFQHISFHRWSHTEKVRKDTVLKKNCFTVKLEKQYHRKWKQIAVIVLFKLGTKYKK